MRYDEDYVDDWRDKVIRYKYPVDREPKKSKITGRSKKLRADSDIENVENELKEAEKFTDFSKKTQVAKVEKAKKEK